MKDSGKDSKGGDVKGLIRSGKYLPVFSSVTMGIPRDEDTDMDDYTAPEVDARKEKK